MGTTPERCFDEQFPDYMEAIGARLSAAGFAVWGPFLPQAGEAARPALQNLSSSGVTINNKSGLDAEHHVDLFRQLSWADQGAA
jgi:hypothetical protein